MEITLLRDEKKSVIVCDGVEIVGKPVEIETWSSIYYAYPVKFEILDFGTFKCGYKYINSNGEYVGNRINKRINGFVNSRLKNS